MFKPIETELNGVISAGWEAIEDLREQKADFLRVIEVKIIDKSLKILLKYNYD